MERGLGIMDINVMCKVELRARIREQYQAARVAKLKYRGVAYVDS